MAPTFKIDEFGARAGSGTDNAAAIQRAIDAAVAAGGGRVVIGAGEYRSGPITIGDGVELLLERGARLRFISDPALYPPAWTRWEGVECYAYHPMVWIHGARGAAIRGEGTIDGGGDWWWETFRAIRDGELSARGVPGVETLVGLNADTGDGSGGGGRESGFIRPNLVQIKDSERITIEGVTIENSPFWNTHILYSRHVEVSDVTFNNPSDAPNTDGLNIDSSDNVHVSGCTFDVGDDCLCVKSGIGEDGLRVGRAVHHVTVEECTMRRGHGGVVIGSETAGGVHDVTVRRCTMLGTDRGVRIKSRRGRAGVIERIRIEDVTMEDVPCPLVVNLYYRCGAREDELPTLASLRTRPVDAMTPRVASVTIRGLRARRVTAACAVLLGLPESPLRDVRLVECEFDVDAPLGSSPPHEPAMDFHRTVVRGDGIVTRFVEGLARTAVTIRGASGLPVADLGATTG